MSVSSVPVCRKALLCATNSCCVYGKFEIVKKIFGLFYIK